MTPTIGRIVHYVLSTGDGTSAHRPAIVVAAAGDVLSLAVFPDGTNDLRGHNPPVARWIPGVLHDEDTKASETWHWPEPAA